MIPPRAQSPSLTQRITFLLLLLSTSTLLAEPLHIIEKGEPRLAIHLATQPTPSAALAARELQHGIELITGCQLEMVHHPDLHGVRLALPSTTFEKSHWTRSADSLGLQRYEHAILFEGGGVTLLGHDAEDSTGAEIDYLKATTESQTGEMIRLPGMFDDQGTLRATYDFIERFCNLRFYGPAPVSVDWQPTTSLTIEARDLRRTPSIPHISGSLTWRWPIMDAQYGKPTEEALRLFERRMRLGGIPWYTNHTLHHYPQRFPQSEHPEFYASEGNGRLCYSSQTLAQQVAQDARDYLDGKPVPNLDLPRGSDYFPVVPEDAARFCQCDECRKWLDPHTNDVPRTPGGQTIFNDGRASSLWFQFINRIAAELTKTHPDKFISTLAYETYFWYPTEFRLAPNVAIAPCMQVRNYWHMASYVNELGHYSRWVSDERPVFLWNYYCFPEEPAVIRNWHCFPGFSAHALGKLAKRYAHDGVLGTFFCGIGEQVDFYLTAKLYDDASQEVDQLLEEFFNRYFGKAGKPMLQFYTLIESTYTNPANWNQNGGHHQTEQVAWEQLGTEELMQALGNLIEQAQNTSLNARHRQRLDHWTAGVWNYMVEGRKTYLSQHSKEP
ncbi:MAG: hypothetical protein RI897_1151 [Verrucomicrobiota bacterium]|jgi:hypothetical protein